MMWLKISYENFNFIKWLDAEKIDNIDFSIGKFGERIVSDITPLEICKWEDALDVYFGCVE